MARHLAAIAAAAALAAGCGGGGDDEPERAVTVDAARPITVVGDEYSFDPGTVVARAGGGRAALELRFRNAGALAHNLRVFRDGREIGGTTTFQGGETRSATVALEPGSYELICTVGNHAELGMTGELTVR